MKHIDCMMWLRNHKSEFDKRLGVYRMAWNYYSDLSCYIKIHLTVVILYWIICCYGKFYFFFHNWFKLSYTATCKWIHLTDTMLKVRYLLRTDCNFSITFEINYDAIGAVFVGKESLFSIIRKQNPRHYFSTVHFIIILILIQIWAISKRISL